MKSSNFTFRGALYSMRPHDLDENTWQLIENNSEKIKCIGTLDQIQEMYDELNVQDELGQ